MLSRTEDDALLDIALQFGGTLDLSSLLDRVLGLFAQLTAAQRAAFALVDSSGKVQRAVTWNMDWDGDPNELPVSHSLIGQVCETRERVVISKVDSDVEFSTTDSVRSLQLQFLVGMPILVNDRVTGVLYADSRAGGPDAWEPRIDLLEALTRLVATALQNAQLYAEQRFRERLLAEMAHDLRSPITVIGANARFMREQGVPATELQSAAEDMLSSTRHMFRIIETSLALSRLDDQSSLDPVDVQIGEALSEVIRPWRVLVERQDISLDLDCSDGLPPLMTVPDTLRVVVENLLANAVKHAPTGSWIRVQASTADLRTESDAIAQPPPSLFGIQRHPPLQPHPETQWLHVEVVNAGEPIPPKLLDRLFDAYTMSESPTAPPMRSTGLGLGIVAVCMQQLGGSVWVRWSDDRGTAIRFSLPVRLIDAS